MKKEFVMGQKLFLFLLLASFSLASCGGSSSTATTKTASKAKAKAKAKPKKKINTKWVKGLEGHYVGSLSNDTLDYAFTLTIKRKGKNVTAVYTIDDPELGDKPYGGKCTKFKALGNRKFQFDYADASDAGTNSDTGVNVFTISKDYKKLEGETWHGTDTSYESDFSIKLKRK